MVGEDEPTHPETDPLDGEYAQVAVDDLPDAPNPTGGKREVDEAVGATAFGYNVFVAAPGEPLPWGYHYHPEHEELLHVLAGELRVETPVGERRVAAGEALFVPPDHPQKAVAIGDDPARVLPDPVCLCVSAWEAGTWMRSRRRRRTSPGGSSSSSTGPRRASRSRTRWRRPAPGTASRSTTGSNC